MAQTTEDRSSLSTSRSPRFHRAWSVAAVTFVTIIGAAAFASLPGLLIEPLHEEFDWSCFGEPSSLGRLCAHALT